MRPIGVRSSGGLPALNPSVRDALGPSGIGLPTGGGFSKPLTPGLDPGFAASLAESGVDPGAYAADRFGGGGFSELDVLPQQDAPPPLGAGKGAPAIGGEFGEVASFIIQQETGGAAWRPHNTNCTIRPQAGCLDLNTGIFQATALSRGLDWNRLMTDPNYAPQAVAQLLSSYAQEDAGNGQSVWEYGEQYLPGGGWEAVGRYYFGGCVTNGCFVDEQGRSVDTYGQQFIDKLANAGIAVGPAPAAQPAVTAPPAQRPQPAAMGTAVSALPPAKLTAMPTIWGGTSEPIVSGFGGNELAAASGNPNLYDYGRELGVTGNPGIDVALPRGTQLAAPISGKVISVGGRYFADGAGGVGEVRIQADNGDVVVLGHLESANVQMGQRIEAGQTVGTSGQYSADPASERLHLEVRVLQPDGTYRAADPTRYFTPESGANTIPPPPGSGGGGTTLTSPQQPASSFTGDPRGQAIADLADDYVNVAYVYGSIPTEGQDPYRTGWDCSGFVTYIADTLGYAANDIPGGVPNGSHYQAQWAIDTGRFRPGLNLDSLQPGDIVFLDTGANGGGGQTEVSSTAARATHVGIYLGDGMMINAMQECGPGMTNGVDCGTGIVSLEDAGWGGMVIGSASMIPPQALPTQTGGGMAAGYSPPASGPR